MDIITFISLQSNVVRKFHSLPTSTHLNLLQAMLRKKKELQIFFEKYIFSEIFLANFFSKIFVCKSQNISKNIFFGNFFDNFFANFFHNFFSNFFFKFFLETFLKKSFQNFSKFCSYKFLFRNFL